MYFITNYNIRILHDTNSVFDFYNIIICCVVTKMCVSFFHPFSEQLSAHPTDQTTPLPSQARFKGVKITGY